MEDDGDGNEAYQRFIAKMSKGTSKSRNDQSQNTSISRNKGVDPITSLQEKGLVNGKDHKSLKFREPSDIQQREQKVSKKIKKNASDQPIGPLNVMPRRENQNEYTLQPCLKRKGEFPPLREEITERTLNNPDYKVDTFPIEDMLRKGFMPLYSYNITDIICTVSNELYRDAVIINNKNAVMAAVSTTNNQAKKRKTKPQNCNIQ